MQRSSLLLALLALGGHAWAADTRDPAMCLADDIYYEAAHEPLAGKVAVGQVVLNRTRDPHYPPSVCSVVYASHVEPSGKRAAAFSWTLGKAWRDPEPRDPVVYAQCYSIALRLLRGNLPALIDDKVEYYHTGNVKPSWRRKHMLVAKIGHHLFYR